MQGQVAGNHLQVIPDKLLALIAGGLVERSLDLDDPKVLLGLLECV